MRVRIRQIGGGELGRVQGVVYLQPVCWSDSAESLQQRNIEVRETIAAPRMGNQAGGAAAVGGIHDGRWLLGYPAEARPPDSRPKLIAIAMLLHQRDQVVELSRLAVASGQQVAGRPYAITVGRARLQVNRRIGRDPV